jgi:toxin ParE1/3/4
VTRRAAPHRSAEKSRRRLAISWSRRAESDLESIGDFIARDNPEAARRWVMRIVEAVGVAARSPRAGRRVPEYDRDEIREVLLRSYRIVYRIGTRQLDVLSVFEGHRRFPSGLDVEP